MAEKRGNSGDRKAWNSDFWFEELSKLSSDHALKSNCWNTSSPALELENDNHYDDGWVSDNDQKSLENSYNEDKVDLKSVHINWSLSEDEEDEENNEIINNQPTTLTTMVTTNTSAFSSPNSSSLPPSRPISLPQSPEQQKLRDLLKENETMGPTHTIASPKGTKAAMDGCTFNVWPSSTSLVDLEPISMQLAPVLTPTPIAPKKITAAQENTNVSATPEMLEETLSSQGSTEYKDEKIDLAPELKLAPVDFNSSFGSFDFSFLEPEHENKTTEAQQLDDQKEAITIDASVIESTDDEGDEDEYDDSQSSSSIDEPKAIRLSTSIEEFNVQEDTNNEVNSSKVEESELSPIVKDSNEAPQLSLSKKEAIQLSLSSSPIRKTVANEPATAITETVPEFEPKIEANDTQSTKEHDEDKLSVMSSSSSSGVHTELESSKDEVSKKELVSESPLILNVQTESVSSIESPSISASEIQINSKIQEDEAFKSDDEPATKSSSASGSEIQPESVSLTDLSEKSPSIPSSELDVLPKDESTTPTQSLSPVTPPSLASLPPQNVMNVEQVQNIPSSPVKSDLSTVTVQGDEEMKTPAQSNSLVDETITETAKEDEKRDEEQQTQDEELQLSAIMTEDGSPTTSPDQLIEQEEKIEFKPAMTYEKPSSPVQKAPILGGTSLSMWADPRLKEDIHASIDAEKKTGSEKRHVDDETESNNVEKQKWQTENGSSSSIYSDSRTESKQLEKSHLDTQPTVTTATTTASHDLPFMQQHPQFTFSIPSSLGKLQLSNTWEAGSTMKQEESSTPTKKNSLGSNASIWSPSTSTPVSIIAPPEIKTISISARELSLPKTTPTKVENSTTQESCSKAASQQWGSSASIWNPEPSQSQQQKDQETTTSWSISALSTQAWTPENQPTFKAQWTDASTTQPQQLWTQGAGLELHTTTQPNVETSSGHQHQQLETVQNEEYESGSEYETDSDSSVEQITVSLASLIQAQKEEAKKQEVPVVRCTLTDLILGTKSEKVRIILDELSGKLPSTCSTTCNGDEDDENAITTASVGSSSASQQSMANAIHEQQQNDVHSLSSPDVFNTNDTSLHQNDEHHKKEEKSTQGQEENKEQQEQKDDEKQPKMDTLTVPLDDEVKQRMVEKAKQWQNDENDNLKLNAFARTFTPPGFVPKTTPSPPTMHSEHLNVVVKQVEKEEHEMVGSSSNASEPFIQKQPLFTNSKTIKAAAIVSSYNSHLSPQEASLFSPPKYFESDDQIYQQPCYDSSAIQYGTKPTSTYYASVRTAGSSQSSTDAATDARYATFDSNSTIFSQQQQSTTTNGTFSKSTLSSIYAKPISTPINISAPEIKLNISAPAFNPSNFKT